MKPHLKLAYTLILIGMGIFTFERFGLDQMGGSGKLHLDGNLVSLLVLAPVILIFAGCVIFVVGAMRRRSKP